ncbi:Ammonium transporter [Pseudomonas synxantha]|uniref:Ammonium transporter n=1 Tax=Pseudomonas synxantha TaxID=47883 RepID=A0A3G7U6Q1_9PSED|nr:Ammonium transporter [Pseudomonas synxantha]
MVQLLLCLGAQALGPALNPGGRGASLEKPYPKSLKPAEKPCRQRPVC